MSNKLSLFLISVFLSGVIALASPSIVDAATRVRGYYRSSGTYVQPHYRSSRDSSFYNNYSSKGNYNPYTGRKGYKSYRY